MHLLSGMKKNLDNTALYLLDLTGVTVDEDFDTMEKAMQKVRGFQVLHGGVLFRTKHVIIPESEDLEAKYESDPMTKLKRFAEIHKLRLVDLFKQFDRDGSWSVSREEFRIGVQVGTWRGQHLRKTCFNCKQETTTTTMRMITIIITTIIVYFHRISLSSMWNQVAELFIGPYSSFKWLDS